MVLVGLMVYTWAILIHMLLKEDEKFNEQLREDYDYDFAKIGDCIWTLLMGGTLMLDNASPLMGTLLFNKDHIKKVAGLAFIAYCFLSALLILQMLIGVLCDVVSQVGQERRDADCVGLVRQELLQAFKDLGGDSGKVNKIELTDVVDSPSSKALLKKLNINRLFLLQVADLMFPDEETRLPIRTVLELIIMCKGDNTATVQIIASALCFLSNEISNLQDHIVLHVYQHSSKAPDQITDTALPKKNPSRQNMLESFV
jgi:hypothetical protein